MQKAIGKSSERERSFVLEVELTECSESKLSYKIRQKVEL